MKNGFFTTLLLLVFLLPERSSAQDLKVAAGIGLPELINLDLRLQFGQAEFGVAAGFIPVSDEEVFAMSGNFYYHFGGHSEMTAVKPWFAKAGITYLRDETEWERTKYIFLGSRIGMEFNISSQFGIAVEAGFIVQVSEDEQVKKERPYNFWGELDFDYDGQIYPSAGVSLFYRF